VYKIHDDLIRARIPAPTAALTTAAPTTAAPSMAAPFVAAFIPSLVDVEEYSVFSAVQDPLPGPCFRMQR